MNRARFLGLMLLAALTPIAAAADPAPEEAAEKSSPRTCYELRVYHAAEGKLDALDARFRDHTLGFFKRHGMTSLGYWHPIENPDRLLIYLLSFPSPAAREASWKAFQQDPEWTVAKAASEADGSLVEKKDSIFLDAADFSPPMKLDLSDTPRTFEMRTYTAAPGKLPDLLKRFRDHTVALFSKHGMRHFGYFTVSPGQPDAGNTLIYFLAHASPEAHAASFAAFGADPAWLKAHKESEVAAGGSLTAPGGVKSVLLKATDYSPVK